MHGDKVTAQTCSLIGCRPRLQNKLQEPVMGRYRKCGWLVALTSFVLLISLLGYWRLGRGSYVRTTENANRQLLTAKGVPLRVISALLHVGNTTSTARVRPSSPSSIRPPSVALSTRPEPDLLVPGGQEGEKGLHNGASFVRPANGRSDELHDLPVFGGPHGPKCLHCRAVTL